MTTKPRDGERVPGREEYATLPDDPTAGDQELQHLRCQQKRAVARREGEPELRCTRQSKLWYCGRVLCEEHWGLADAIAGDWLRMAEAWHHEDLVRLARAVLGEVRLELAGVRARKREALE